jgi:hypothetical protein
MKVSLSKSDQNCFKTQAEVQKQTQRKITFSSKNHVFLQSPKLLGLSTNFLRTHTQTFPHNPLTKTSQNSRKCCVVSFEFRGFFFFLQAAEFKGREPRKRWNWIIYKVKRSQYETTEKSQHTKYKIQFESVVTAKRRKVWKPHNLGLGAKFFFCQFPPQKI